MGALAELIKAAEEKQAISPGAMSKQLEELQTRLSAMPPAAEAYKALSKHAPTAESESRRNALKWTALAALGGTGIGALLSLLRTGRESTSRRKLYEDIDPYAGMPGREITIPLPHAKKGSAKEAGVLLPAAVTAATVPAVARSFGTDVGGMWEKAKGGVQRGFEHLFSPTGSPFDNPWFMPAAIAALFGGGYLGYSQLNKVLEKMRERRSSRQIEQARKEFEEALRTQYRESELSEQAAKGKRSTGGSEGGFKFSAAGMIGFAADALAQSHVAGELSEQLDSLEKSAQEMGGDWTKGLGRKALGVYLATMALLATAGGAAGYHFVKSREPARRKHEAAKEILRRRALAAPPTVSVESA